MIMKYIMFNVDGNKVPIIFDKIIRHDLMFTYMIHILEVAFNPRIMPKPSSAGFYDTKTDHCYGESESLKIKSNPEDTVILAKDK